MKKFLTAIGLACFGMALLFSGPVPAAPDGGEERVVRLRITGMT